MQINDFRIKVDSLSDRYFIEGIGDFHVGNRNCNKDKMKKRIDVIKNDPNRYALVMGDLADSITVSDKRYDIATYDRSLEEPDRQYEYITDLLEPIKHKIIGIHTGNHDDVLRKKISIGLRGFNYSENEILLRSDWVRKVCSDLNVLYAGYNAFTRLTFDDGKSHIRQFKIFSTHGSSSCKTSGAALNILNNFTKSYKADIYFMGHTHHLSIDKIIYLDVAQRGNKLLKCDCVLGATGGFLEGYVPYEFSYIESKNLPPLRTGTVTVSVDPLSRGLNIHL